MRSTSLQDRTMIGKLADAGLSDREIAERLGWQLSTVRKWRRRGQKLGPAGLVSQMGRPAKGALSTFAGVVCTLLRAWRDKSARWGPGVLYAKATDEQANAGSALAGKRLPKRATIARWLKQEHLTRSYECHQELVISPVASVQAAHAAWEMDAYGTVPVPGVGMISLINLNDCFSRAKLLSFPCWVGDQRITRHADTADYLLALRLAFVRWGLPQQIRVDRDSVYYDNTSKSPFPTRLHLFLLGLGVDLLIGPRHQPRKRAITERSHQTWAWQVLEGQTFRDWYHLWHTLEDHLTFLNYRLPCHGSDDLPPLVAHPQAARPRRPYDPLQEPVLFSVAPIVAYLAQGCWFRLASNVGVATLGDQHYTLGESWAKREVQITFDPDTRDLIFLDRTAQRTMRRPIKGLTYADLAGDMNRFFELHPFQLALPFTWPHEGVTRLFETLGVTT